MNLFITPLNHPITAHKVAAVGRKVQRDQFISVIADEMKSPLMHIHLSLELMESLMVGEEQKLYRDIIARNSRRIARLVNELLLFRDSA